METRSKNKEESIEKIYEELYSLYKQYLQSYHVNPPAKLKNSKHKYQITSLSLLFLYIHLGKTITKSDCNLFLQKYDVVSNDNQSLRHFKRYGWYVIGETCTGTLGNKLKPGEYELISVKEPHPSFIRNIHIVLITEHNFDELRKQYDDRCACCGSKENEKHFKDKTKIVPKLQKGHMDPQKELTSDNCIPQCDLCNRQYKNKAIFNKNGHVVDWIGNCNL